MQFKNLAEMQKGLTSIIQNALVATDDVRSVVAKYESEAVEEYVYAKYTPDDDGYQRRGLEGGLADPRNLELVGLGNNGKTIQMVYENMTTGNDSMSGELITDGIQSGNQDMWDNPNGAWSDRRPFMNQAVDKLKSNAELRQAVISSLKKKNISAK